MPRTETITKTIYTYTELSDKAKSRARHEYCRVDDGMLGNDATEWATEWATETGKLLGIQVEKDGWHYDSSYGTASCKGTYTYRKGGVAAVKSECGDETMPALAEQLAAAQKRHGYKAEAGLQHCNSGFGINQVIYIIDRNGDDIEDDDLKQALLDFVSYAAQTIAEAYEHAYSEEQLAEHFEANEYEFEEDGTLA